MVQKGENVAIAMGLVIAAGAATGIGGCVVFFPSLVRLASRKSLAGALGLSAGVMIFVSFAEVLVKSQDAFADAGFSENESRVYGTLCFFGGIVLMILLNQVVTCLLGGHHHHGHSGNASGGRKASGANGNDSSSSSYDEASDEDSESIPPCPCHDEHPIETLEKVKSMAESMAEHPDRAHPGQGLHRGQHHHHGAAHRHPHHHHHEEVHKETTPPEQSPPPVTHIGGIDVDNDQSSVGPQSACGSIPAQKAPTSEHQFSTSTADIETPVLPPDEDVVSSDDEDSNATDAEEAEARNKSLMRMSFQTALAIGLHNFPEGLATFVAALDDPATGAVLAFAIAIHNIPEGLCVSMPIYYATGNKWQAFGWACLSGAAEPVAGLLGWLILAQSFSNQIYGVLFGFVAGMMVTISVRELLPTAHRYDPEDSIVTYCFIAGMAIMALSLILFMI